MIHNPYVPSCPSRRRRRPLSARPSVCPVVRPIVIVVLCPSVRPVVVVRPRSVRPVVRPVVVVRPPSVLTVARLNYYLHNVA